MDDRTQPRRYWAQRQGTDGGRLNLQVACRLFRSMIGGLSEQGYFQEWFGYYCVDAREVPGRAGPDETAFALRRTRLEGLWPPTDEWLAWDYLHLLTAVEFLYDSVSKPEDGSYHDYAHCGWHYSTFDATEGQQIYRQEVNGFLGDLDDGFFLQPNGEVVHKLGEDTEELIARPLPETTEPSIKERVADASRKFRRGTATPGDRRDAIRDLADVFELLRPRLRVVLSDPDEDALFNIANNFAVRHMNQRQRTNYDREVWFPWMFSFFLATIHASLALLEKARSPATGDGSTSLSARPAAEDEGPSWLK